MVVVWVERNLPPNRPSTLRGFVDGRLVSPRGDLMCQLCSCGKPAKGRKLCPVCNESILRLANAVRAIHEEQCLAETVLVHAVLVHSQGR